MEKRLIVAVLLMSAVILVTNILFPPPPPEDAAVEQAAVEVEVQPSGPAPVSPVLPTVGEPAEGGETVVVESDLYRLAFSTRGAAIVGAELLQFESYTRPGAVQLVPSTADEFLSSTLVIGRDSIPLSSLNFQPSAPQLTVRGEQPAELRFVHGSEDGFRVEIVYTFLPDEYLVEVRGQVRGLGGAAASYAVSLAPGLASNEAYEHRSEQQLAVVTRSPGDVNRHRMHRLAAEQAVQERLTWAGIKDKYFLAVVIGGEEMPLEGARIQRLPDVDFHYAEEDRTVQVPQARVTSVVPVSQAGEFSFQTYLGPQDYTELRAIGYDLQNVTQYAYRWLEPVIRPVAALVLWVLRSLHSVFGVAYGWVLVLFGVLMRIVLWPLNAKAMRSQMKNMAVQPLMTEIRDKYKDDPQAQQREMMKLYKEHGFNPFAGCLPLLVPFPVLITLFFVFQNTIAFRGAEFLWLPDLSVRDPFFILPIFLVLSMFALQWISMKMSGMQDNPQMKMMMYVMPVMMGILFFSLPAGLNLYYATTNIASIPQQMLIARERRAAQEAAKREAAAQKRLPGGKKKARKRK